MKKPAPVSVCPEPEGDDGVFSPSEMPALVSFLKDVTWDDGSKRTPGTILILVEDSRWKAWVNCKDSGRSAWVSAAHLTGLLTLLETALASDSLDWRRARPERARGR